MLRKGFTLIELLIVITIIAILAGAAIPYVQDYVDDARFAKVKADLDQIKNALIRYETDRGTSYVATTTAPLVGPYLQTSVFDPWGSPYVIDATASSVLSYGPDRTAAGGDNIVTEFRPPLALSKAYWEDSDQNGAVSEGDSLVLYFTRPVTKSTTTPVGDSFTFDTTTPAANAVVAPAVASYSDSGRSVKLTLGAGYAGAGIAPGRTVLKIADRADITDPDGNQIRDVNDAIIKAR